MKGIQNFTSKRLSRNESSKVKGGVFCEVYIGHRSGKTLAPGQMKEAMELDQIAATDGMSAALAAGGTEFLAQYS